MEQKWASFIDKVERRIEPVLEQAGFKRAHFEMSEEDPRGHPAFMYERENDHLRIDIDALERPGVESGKLQYFSSVRVGIGRYYLRDIFPPSPTANMHVTDGWEYADEAGLERSVNEIVELLKKYFNKNPE